MKSILSAVVGATLALSAIEADAQATPGERQVALTIETDTLAGALDKWAQQSGFQILVQDWEAAKNLPARSLKGTFTAEGALEQLLSGTPLTYVWISDKAVSIRKKAPQAVPTALQRTSLEEQQSIPVAQFSGDDVGSTSPASAAASSAEERTVNALERARRADLRAESLEEITVIGSNIRGTQNQTVPVIVLDKADIDATGVSTTTALIESLPQNFALASQSGVLVPGVTAGRAQGASVNLRGIGEGTTLVLLNGRRMALGYIGSAVDISALPLSAIERVEILTDGASAVYGSDAVGGVVNFVLRDNFDGAETRIRSGWADGGLNEYRINQALGTNWNSGNAMASFEYYDRDMLLARDRAFVPDTVLIGSLLPRDRNRSAMLSGRQSLSDDIRLFADALVAERDTFNEGGLITEHENYSSSDSQITAASGLDWRLAGDWQLEASGSYASDDLSQSQRRFDAVALELDVRFDIRAAQLKADGSLFALPGGAVRAAIGADWRSEALEFQTSAGGANDLDQRVRSLFAEFYVPLIGAANSVGGARRLELSLAGRYDDYSSFGSSLDPRIGILWEPIEAMRLRASFGTSYVAPKLLEYSPGSDNGFAVAFADPFAPGGVSNQLYLSGTDIASLTAQEAESASVGLDVTPVSVPGFRLGVNYYRIDYKKRIAAPPVAPDLILGNPESFGSLVTRDPTVEQVNRYIAIAQAGLGFIAFNPDFTPNSAFTPDSVDVLVDLRRRNLSVLKTSGVDLSVQYAFQAGDNKFSFDLAGTHITQIDQQITSSSTPFDTVDTFQNPPDWRARASMGWQRHGWAANFYVDHTDAYVDNRAQTDVRVSSFTSVDGRLAYDFSEAYSGTLLDGMTISASVQNLFDRDPPRTAVLFADGDLGFDPTNANPMGRLIALELMKTWGHR
jgi:iron complex outermembrane recepter protein